MGYSSVWSNEAERSLLPLWYGCEKESARAERVKALKEKSREGVHGIFVNMVVEAGRVELPSEKGPRKASTGLVCVRIFASGVARRRASVSYPAVSSSRASRSEQTLASPMNWRLGDVSDVGRFGVTVYAVRVPGCLRSVGVVVIVVGNYFVAAFNEASGASTCNPGFQHPRRNQCAPRRDFPSRGKPALLQRSASGVF